MAKEKNFKPKRSSGNTLVNVIITVVVVALFGLSVYAVGGKLSSKFAEQREQEEAEKKASQTVKEAAEEKDMSFEDFLAEYGLSDVKEDDLMQSAEAQMTCANYAKFEGKTFAEVVEENSFPESVTEDMTMNEAAGLVPIGNGMTEEEFNTEIQKLGLEGQVTYDMPTKDAMPLIQAKAAEQQENQVATEETAPVEEGAAAEATTQEENKAE